MKLLNERDNQGLTVKLWWCPITDDIKVTVKDDVTGDKFTITTEGKFAKDAFDHPFSYRAMQEAREMASWA